MQTQDVLLQEAAAARLGHGEFLELIFQDELNVRHQRMLACRTKAAEPSTHTKTLEDFDWQFNPSINRKTNLHELAAGNYLREGKDILFFLACPASEKTASRRPWATKPSSRARKRPLPLHLRSGADFLKDEAFKQQDKTLRRYPQA